MTNSDVVASAKSTTTQISNGSLTILSGKNKYQSLSSIGTRSNDSLTAIDNPLTNHFDQISYYNNASNSIVGISGTIPIDLTNATVGISGIVPVNINSITSSTNSTTSSIIATTGSVTILSSNLNRFGFMLFNESTTTTWYIKFGPNGTTSDYTFQLLPGDLYENNSTRNTISGTSSSSGTGTLRITELI